MYKLRHHQLILKCLNNFNQEFLASNHILFGGGTRISLELDEYRESVDIDFLCQDKKSYRAVREQITNRTLGQLVQEDFVYSRDIVSDRNAVRTFIEIEGSRIKLEFVCFDNYELSASDDVERFPVPFIDHTSCFYTKLLANADRAGVHPYKDILDLIMMSRKWGGIPEQALELARGHYGQDVDRKLVYALKHFTKNQPLYKQQAEDMGVNPDTFTQEIVPTGQALLEQYRPAN